MLPDIVHNGTNNIKQFILDKEEEHEREDKI